MEEIKLFFSELFLFIFNKLNISFWKFEKGKGVFVGALYKQRGKLSRRLAHTGMAVLAGAGVMIAPVVAREFPGRSVDPWSLTTTPSVLSVFAEGAETQTSFSQSRDKIIQYQVAEGDTVSSIAEKFAVSPDTIRWQNNLTKDRIKVGDTLEILPVAGMAHKVQKGDTVYSIAKKYDAQAQAIVDFPFNTFTNDETFALAIGQTVIVPDGIKPAAAVYVARVRQITPDAGSVTASGIFVWPTSGTITQNFTWYHKGIDIANSAAPDVLAADAGTIKTAGWSPVGYGNHVIIDHGNGYRTLYGHLQTIYVVSGQTVNRGARIGRMGSSGHSTGVHTHFEVVKNGVYLNPLNVLK